jgi:predicted metal-dependent hydrolase
MPRLPEHTRRQATGQPTAKARARSNIGERTVPYVLRRGQTPDDRSVDRSSRPARRRAANAPRCAKSSRLILQHGEWIRKKLDEWRTRRPRHRCRSSMACACRYLASPLQIRLAARRQSLRVEPPDGRADAHPLPALPRPTRRACSSRYCAKGRARSLPSAWPTTRRCLALSVPRLSLSAARTRWGSCSQRTGIRLNWRLIHFPPPVVDYVVAHEVAHLREMNHSPRFWAIVARLYPDYRAARQELRRLAVDCPRW